MRKTNVPSTWTTWKCNANIRVAHFVTREFEEKMPALAAITQMTALQYSHARNVTVSKCKKSFSPRMLCIITNGITVSYFHHEIVQKCTFWWENRSFETWGWHHKPRFRMLKEIRGKKFAPVPFGRNETNKMEQHSNVLEFKSDKIGRK